MHVDPLATLSGTGVLKAKAEAAREGLARNLRVFEQCGVRLLIAGQGYDGIWLEHNQDNLFIAEQYPEEAWASQQVFMDFQREDGLLPFMLPLRTRGGVFDTEAAYWHVQSVYPFARCALELAKKLGKGEATMAAVYDAGRRYDDWLVRNRNKKGTGLVEMYCEYDTGHDNNPRVTDGGIPHDCPDRDAARMPALALMPVLSVDLSAMMYGGREALAELAERLGKDKEGQMWRERAAELAERMRKHLYDAEDEFYYDRDERGFRRYRSEHITRLMLNGVVGQEEMERMWSRHFEREGGLWTAYPIASMAVSDEHFVRECPRNCWGANTQALTALRGLLWMERYGKGEAMRQMLGKWVEALARKGNGFTQELHPLTGEGIGDGSGYTPSMILFLEGLERLGLG